WHAKIEQILNALGVSVSGKLRQQCASFSQKFANVFKFAGLGKSCNVGQMLKLFTKGACACHTASRGAGSYNQMFHAAIWLWHGKSAACECPEHVAPASSCCHFNP